MSTARAAVARLKRQLKAGEEMAFSPVDVLGRKRLSHTIAFRCGRYVVTAADGQEVGTFATFAQADHEGRISTAEAHAIDRW